jgi:hypothetical protein
MDTMLQIGEVFSKLSGQIIQYGAVEVVIGGFGILHGTAVATKAAV